MRTAIIVGSGPAAAGAALSLARNSDLRITVLDLGLKLDPARQQVVDALAATGPAQWDEVLVQGITAQPQATRSGAVPEKRAYGSDFPFRDVGQLSGLSASSNATATLVSGAYGGFTNVWGSQLMPFTDSALGQWPVSAGEMRHHYAAVLSQIPFAAEDDDLSARFPLIGSPVPLPELSPRSQRVLDAYQRHRRVLNGRGIRLGKARLAFDAASCVRCTKCMTGCPYSLIYSASHTFESLRRSQRVDYFGGLLALRVCEDAAKASVVAKDLATGRLEKFEADRVYVGCGAMGTTRLVANSMNLFDHELSLIESQQYVAPMMSLRATPDPRGRADFTLNQFNMIVELDGSDVDLSQLHFYSFNPSFIEALPGPLGSAGTERATRQLLQRLTVALGYLPSWRSPQLQVRARPGADCSHLPEVHVSRGAAPRGRNQMLRAVMWKMGLSAPLLDLYPFPMPRLAAGGKSYHVGGSFPHKELDSKYLSSDRLGRVRPWQRIHLVDASVFPTVPAMTFTLTIMANAHRIATESVGLPS